MQTGTGRQPEDNRIHFNHAVELAGKGRWEEAAAAYQEALRINPNDSEAQMNLGFVYYELGYDDKAQQAFERARRLQSSCKC